MAAVANHRVIIRCGQTFYSVRGKGLEEIKPGETVKRKVTLSGVGRDGMVFATVGGS